MAGYLQQSHKHIRHPDVTLITWNNQQVPCLLEQSLAALGTTCQTLGRDQNPWRNAAKINLTLQALENIDTPYVMGIDGFDAVLTGNPTDAISLLQHYNAKIVFNASNLATYSPTHVTMNFQYRYAEYKFCQLNAGVWIADTESATQFFTLAANVTNDTIEQILHCNQVPSSQRKAWRDSEQLRVKCATDAFGDDVAIDYERRKLVLLTRTPECANTLMRLAAKYNLQQ